MTGYVLAFAVNMIWTAAAIYINFGWAKEYTKLLELYEDTVL